MSRVQRKLIRYALWCKFISLTPSISLSPMCPWIGFAELSDDTEALSDIGFSFLHEGIKGPTAFCDSAPAPDCENGLPA